MRIVDVSVFVGDLCFSWPKMFSRLVEALGSLALGQFRSCVSAALKRPIINLLIIKRTCLAVRKVYVL